MAKKESTQKNYRAHDEWMAFVFTPYNYDNGPAGGWFDFVGARNTIEDAREAV